MTSQWLVPLSRFGGNDQVFEITIHFQTRQNKTIQLQKFMLMTYVVMCAEWDDVTERWSNEKCQVGGEVPQY